MIKLKILCRAIAPIVIGAMIALHLSIEIDRDSSCLSSVSLTSAIDLHHGTGFGVLAEAAVDPFCDFRNVTKAFSVATHQLRLFVRTLGYIDCEGAFCCVFSPSFFCHERAPPVV